MLKVETKNKTEKIDKVEIQNQALVTRIKQGDQKALSDLCAFNQKFILNLLRQRTLGNVELAEDLTQESLIKMVSSIANYQKSEFKFRTWLSKIVANIFIDNYRANKNSVDTLAKYMDFNLTLGSDEMGGQTADNYTTLKSINTLKTSSVEDTWIAQLENERLRKQIMTSIEALPNINQQRVVVLNLIEELTYDEIAEKLGISLSNVKVLLHRAKADILKHIVINNSEVITDDVTKKVMELSFVEGMDNAAIARKLKRTVEDVEVILTAGLRKVNREQIFTEEVFCVN